MAKVPKTLDAITDRVLSYRPSKPEPEPSEIDHAEAWSTSIASILEDDILLNVDFRGSCLEVPRRSGGPKSGGIRGNHETKERII